MKSYDLKRATVPRALANTSIVVDKINNVAVCRSSECVVPRRSIPEHVRDCESCTEIDLRAKDASYHTIYDQFDQVGDMFDDYAKRLRGQGVFGKTLELAHLPAPLYGLRVETNEMYTCRKCFDKTGKFFSLYGRNRAYHVRSVHNGDADVDKDFLLAPHIKFRSNVFKTRRFGYPVASEDSLLGQKLVAKQQHQRQQQQQQQHHQQRWRQHSAVSTSSSFGSRRRVVSDEDDSRPRKRHATTNGKYNSVYTKVDVQVDEKLELLANSYFKICYKATVCDQTNVFVERKWQTRALEDGQQLQFNRLFVQFAQYLSRAASSQKEADLFGLNRMQTQAIRKLNTALERTEFNDFVKTKAPTLPLSCKEYPGSKLGPLEGRKHDYVHHIMDDEKLVRSVASLVKEVHFSGMTDRAAHCAKLFHQFWSSLIAGVDPNLSSVSPFSHLVEACVNDSSITLPKRQIMMGLKYFCHMNVTLFSARSVYNTRKSAFSNDDRLEVMRQLIHRLVQDRGVFCQVNPGQDSAVLPASARHEYPQKRQKSSGSVHRRLSSDSSSSSSSSSAHRVGGADIESSSDDEEPLICASKRRMAVFSSERSITPGRRSSNHALQECTPAEPLDELVVELVDMAVQRCIEAFTSVGFNLGCVWRVCERLTAYSDYYDGKFANKSGGGSAVVELQQVCDEIMLHQDELPRDQLLCCEICLACASHGSTRAQCYSNQTIQHVKDLEAEVRRVNDCTTWLAMLVRLTAPGSMTRQDHTKWTTVSSNNLSKARSCVGFVSVEGGDDDSYAAAESTHSAGVGRMAFGSEQPGPPFVVPWIVSELVTVYASIIKPYYEYLGKALQLNRNLTGYEVMARDLVDCRKKLFTSFRVRQIPGDDKPVEKNQTAMLSTEVLAKRLFAMQYAGPMGNRDENKNAVEMRAVQKICANSASDAKFDCFNEANKVGEAYLNKLGRDNQKPLTSVYTDY